MQGFLLILGPVSIARTKAHMRAAKKRQMIDWTHIEHKRDRWAALGPAQAEGLDHWIDVELTYTSNAIEGNTLTRIETALVLEKGLTVSGKPLRDHLEAVGHLEALRYIRILAGRDEPIRPPDEPHSP
jgi:Fic family protein